MAVYSSAQLMVSHDNMKDLNVRRICTYKYIGDQSVGVIVLVCQENNSFHFALKSITRMVSQQHSVWFSALFSFENS